MLPSPRLRHALLVSLGLGAALAPSGCGPQPVGVEACRRIEGARCEAAAACGFDEAKVADCKVLYSDQCLHGIENADHRPTETDTDGCVAAVEATGACAAAGTAAMSACSGAPLVAGAADRTPCDVILHTAHDLAACAFAAAEPGTGGSGGTTTTTTTTTTDSGGGGAGGTTN